MIDLEFVRTIVSICSGIGTIGAAAGVLYTVYSHAKKPQQDIEKRVGAIETDIKDIKEKLDNDYSNIRQNREDTKLLMRSMFNLIENKITGNNVEGLKKTPGRFAGSFNEELRGLILKVYDFTVPELNRFRALANFTPDERTLFEYRAAGVPMEICAENMNVSLATAKRISRRVNSKIIRVCGTL